MIAVHSAGETMQRLTAARTGPLGRRALITDAPPLSDQAFLSERIQEPRHNIEIATALVERREPPHERQLLPERRYDFRAR